MGSVPPSDILYSIDTGENKEGGKCECDSSLFNTWGNSVVKHLTLAFKSEQGIF